MGVRRDRTSIAVALISSLVLVSLETLGCWLFLGRHLPDIVLVYLLGIVLLAVRLGYVASLPATVLSIAAFDFFFTSPLYSFAVSDKRLLLTFVLMAFVASVISNQTELIRRREARTATLYAMSVELTVAGSIEEVASVACRHVAGVFASEVWVLLPDGSGQLSSVASIPPSTMPDEKLRAMAEQLVAPAVAEHLVGEAEGSTELDARVARLPSSKGVVGVLAMRGLTARRLPRIASSDLFDLFVSQVAIALERARLGDLNQRAQLEVKTERLRNALLSSVSHDLRTPLGVIKGAVTALIDGASMSPARQRENLETISAEASRLNRLVRNLLDVTSLEAGTVRVRKEWQPLEEVIGVALNRLEEQLEGRSVRVGIEPEAALVPFDATLIEQVLVNLVENATKYTPPSAPIEIGARRIENRVEVEVADRGRGIPDDQLESIFEKFRRVSPGTAGMGLGLTICRGMVLAHGGQISCRNREGGGAVFHFELPLNGEPPTIKALPEAAAADT
jgi:two-component system sensor histidine kinase KdpD